VRACVAGVVLLLFGTGAAHAQGVSASDITTRGRPLEKILATILFPESGTPQSVLFVVDPSRALRTAGFSSKLGSVLTAHRRDADRLRLGIMILGAKKDAPPLPPGSDFNDVRKQAVAATSRPRNVLRDVYSPLKKAIQMFAREPGRRTIVLLTQQNGDTEYKIEKVIAALRSAKIRVVVITREVLLSDSYWYGYSSARVKPPARAYLGGSDAAFVQIPHGWVHQDRDLTNVAGSGFATWGLARMAAATGGTVEVLYTSESSTHRCGGSFVCRFCRGSNHVARHQTLRALRLKAVEPLLESRRVVFKRAGSDPYYKGVLKAWAAAYKAGLTLREPTAQRAGSGLSARRERQDEPGYIYLDAIPSWRKAAQEARIGAKAANRIATSLRKSIAAGDRAGGNARYRSIAELTYVMLRLTRLNLLYLDAFYKKVAPKMTAKRAPTPEPPEIAVIRRREDVTGYYLGWDTIPLCHGVRPFLDLKLPGGNALDVELRAFAVDYDSFLKRNAHTPFLVALSHMGIAEYSLMVIGKGNVKGSTGAVRRSPTSRKKGNTDTAREREPERGEHGSGSSSGGSEAPTSGG